MLPVDVARGSHSRKRLAIRQDKTRPLLDALHAWMALQRRKVPEGSATDKALDDRLKRWAALVCASQATGNCRWTTTGARTRFGRLPLAATTGSLRAAYELVRGQQPS